MTEDEKVLLKLRNARTQIHKAVERAGKATDTGVEFRRGHLAEAIRLARSVRDEADAFIRQLEAR